MRKMQTWFSAAVIGTIVGVIPAPTVEGLRLGATPSTYLTTSAAEARSTKDAMFLTERSVIHMDTYLRRLDRLASDTDSVRCSYRKNRKRFDAQKTSVLNAIGRARQQAPGYGYSNNHNLERSLTALKEQYARTLSCYE